MHDDISTNSYSVESTAPQEIAIRVGWIILIGFAILRPLTLMGKDIGMSGINLLEIFGTGISYLFILPLIAGLKQIKFDRVAFISILFCLYCANSLFWGSEIRKVAIAILPFLLYFSVRTFITDFKQVRTFLIAIYISFLIPIALSTFNIIVGRNIPVIEYWNELPRNAGVFAGPHTLAYTMLLVSFFFCILHHVYQFKNIFYQFTVNFFLGLSFYCLYQSHTRTVIIGFLIFWLIYLFGKNIKIFFIAILLALSIGILFQDHFKTLIWKTPEEKNVDRATSGRVTMFAKNLKLFSDSSLQDKLLGRGLIHESRYGFHNDFMRLLISLGLIGLFLYLTLLFYLLWDIFWCKDKKTKYLFGAILITVAAMNFGSNAFVFRIESSQYFWLIVGLFYNLQEIRNGTYDTKPS